MAQQKFGGLSLENRKEEKWLVRKSEIMENGTVSLSFNPRADIYHVELPGDKFIVIDKNEELANQVFGYAVSLIEDCEEDSAKEYDIGSGYTRNVLYEKILEHYMKLLIGDEVEGKIEDGEKLNKDIAVNGINLVVAWARRPGSQGETYLLTIAEGSFYYTIDAGDDLAKAKSAFRFAIETAQKSDDIQEISSQVEQFCAE